MPTPTFGTVTRGTTNTNRLRRVDRWIAHLEAFQLATDPLVVDLGFGSSVVTTLELHERLSKVRPDVEIIGIEIDPARVVTAQQTLLDVREGHTHFAPDLRVEIAQGGFEIPLPPGRKAAVIRAFNVLRQYDESQVSDAWSRMCEQLQPEGVLIEGTCDEIGRVASWITVSKRGPRTLTLALRMSGLENPSIVAERLPKALIHHNIPGEPVHAFLTDLERLWNVHAPLRTYGYRQRWLAVARGMREKGWPVRGGLARWRLGELTVDWDAVSPRSMPRYV